MEELADVVRLHTNWRWSNGLTWRGQKEPGFALCPAPFSIWQPVLYGTNEWSRGSEWDRVPSQLDKDYAYLNRGHGWGFKRWNL